MDWKLGRLKGTAIAMAVALSFGANAVFFRKLLELESRLGYMVEIEQSKHSLQEMQIDQLIERVDAAEKKAADDLLLRQSGEDLRASIRRIEETLGIQSR